SVAEVKYVAPPADGQTVDLTTRGFMALPVSTGVGAPGLNKATRTVSVPADADPTTRLYRIGLENHAHLNWNVWLPNSATAQLVQLPDPSAVVAGLVDPLQDATDENGKTAGATALLLAVSLGSSGTLGDVSGFNAVSLDQLGTTVDAFTLV